MINRDLLDFMYQYIGMGEMSEITSIEEIHEVEKEMGITLPETYIDIILEYGGIEGGDYICQNFITAKWQTLSFREEYGIPEHFFEFTICQHLEGYPKGQYILFMDTSRNKDGDCPTVIYSCEEDKYWDYAATVEETLNMRIEAAHYHMFLDEKSNARRKKLRAKESITGIGVHSCSALVNGSSQQELADMIGLHDVRTMPHREALELVRKNKSYAMITPEFKGTNFVIFSQNDSEQLMTRAFVEGAFTGAPFVHMISTMCTDNAAGFMTLEDGRCKRIRMMNSKLDNSNINWGKPLEVEDKVAKRFPSYREPWQYEYNITLMTEFMDFKKGKYPYEDVVVGTIDINRIIEEGKIIVDSREDDEEYVPGPENVYTFNDPDNFCLPDGFGYKSAFLIAENPLNESIINEFVPADRRDKDLAYIESADKSKRITLLRSDKLSSLFCGNKYNVIKYFTLVPNVYFFITDRITESHGFAFQENKIMNRFYICSEEEIENTGEVTVYEKENNIVLPSDFDEIRDRSGKFTRINEDTIVDMATEICKELLTVE